MSSRQEPPSPPAPGRQGLDDLSFYLGRAYYHYVLFLQDLLERYGLDATLRPGMGGVLFALFERDNCIIKEISERLDMAPSTLTPTLRRMEKAGIIRCRKCPEDGRAVRVRLTAKGRALAGPCRQLSEVLNGRLVEGLEREEVQLLKRALSRLIHNIRQPAGS